MLAVRSLIAVVLFAVVLLAGPAGAQSASRFTYQGTLENNGQALDGDVSMSFSLWDDAVGGTQQGGTLQFDNMNNPLVTVEDGRFTVELDFGASSHADSGARWLEITVDGNTLSPRQPLTATPFAINTRGINVSSGGNVGIGTSNPTHQLETIGTAPLATGFRSSSTIGTWLNLSNSSAGGRFWRMISTGSGNGEGAGKLLFGYGPSAGSVAGTVMTLQSDGRIGIGSSSPNSMLSIENLGAIDDGRVIGLGETGQEIFGLRSDFLGGGATGNALRLWTIWNPDALTLRGDGRVDIDGGAGIVGDVGVTGDIDVTGAVGVAGDVDVTGDVGIDGNARATSLSINTTASTSPLTFRNRDERKITFWESAPPNGFYGFNMSLGGRVQAFAGIRGSFEIGHDDGAGGYTERMRVNTNGRVGIGTIAPSESLHVIGNIRASGVVVASCGVLTCSDERYKLDIEPVDGALDLVSNLQAVRYDWRQDEYPQHAFSDDRQLGFVAQTVREVAPEIVHEDRDGYLAVDYARITPLVVEAVKELKAEKDEQISRLEAENAELRDRLERLEALLTGAVSAEKP